MNTHFTDVFVKRPVFAIVISLVLMLLGGYAYTELGVKETPSVEAPVVTVTTTWPGADPAIMESDVTEILERQLNGIEGVRTISSISREQVSTITVEFVLSRSLEEAANDVRSKDPRVISRPGSPVTVMVVPTNEELAMARETKAAIA